MEFMTALPEMQGGEKPFGTTKLNTDTQYRPEIFGFSTFSTPPGKDWQIGLSAALPPTLLPAWGAKPEYPTVDHALFLLQTQERSTTATLNQDYIVGAEMVINDMVMGPELLISFNEGGERW